MTKEIRLTKPENSTEFGEDENGKYKIYTYYRKHTTKNGDVHYIKNRIKTYIVGNRFQLLEDSDKFNSLVEKYVEYIKSNDCRRGEGKITKMTLRRQIFDLGNELDPKLEVSQLDKYLYRVAKHKK